MKTFSLQKTTFVNFVAYEQLVRLDDIFPRMFTAGVSYLTPLLSTGFIP